MTLQTGVDPTRLYITNAVFRIVQNYGEKSYFRREGDRPRLHIPSLPLFFCNGVSIHQ